MFRPRRAADPVGEIDAAAESAHLPRDVSEGQLGRFGSHQLALDRGVESRAHHQRRAPTGSAGDRRGDLVVVSVEPSRELGPRAVGVVVRREAPSVSRPEGFHVRVVEVIDDGPRRLARRLDPEEVRGVVDESDDVKSHLSGEVGEHGARRTCREERGRRGASDARPTCRRESARFARARRGVATGAIRARASSEARGLVTTQWRFVVYFAIAQTKQRRRRSITRRRGREARPPTDDDSSQQPATDDAGRPLTGGA